MGRAALQRTVFFEGLFVLPALNQDGVLNLNLWHSHCWLSYLIKSSKEPHWRHERRQRTGRSLDNLWLTVGEFAEWAPRICSVLLVWAVGGSFWFQPMRAHQESRLLMPTIKFTSFLSLLCVWEENNNVVTRSRQTWCKIYLAVFTHPI